MPKVVALYSSAMQSGKSTAAEVFRQYGYIQVSFAEPMKKMIDTLLQEVGIDTERRIRYIYGDLKEQVIPELGRSARHLMQTLGTEWARKCNGENFWVDIAREKIRGLLERGYSVIIDDMRYPDEAIMLEVMFDAYMYRIVRPYQQDATGHSSEGALDHWVFNGYITNDGTIAEFRTKIESLV